jgi:hypothetical protein
MALVKKFGSTNIMDWYCSEDPPAMTDDSDNEIIDPVTDNPDPEILRAVQTRIRREGNY